MANKFDLIWFDLFLQLYVYMRLWGFPCVQCEHETKYNSYELDRNKKSVNGRLCS